MNNSYSQASNLNTVSNYEYLLPEWLRSRDSSEGKRDFPVNILTIFKDNKASYSEYNDPFTGLLKIATDDLKGKLLKISQRCAALPDIDKRPPDEILGYNNNPFGLPR